MRFPNFTAQASLASWPQDYGGATRPPLMDRVVPAQLTFWECLEACETALDPVDCAIFCAGLFGVTWGAEVNYGPGMFSETGQMIAEGGTAAEGGGGVTAGSLGVLALATLAAIAAGVGAGYLIEKHGLLAPNPPKPGTPAPTCAPTSPAVTKAQHSITSTSRLGCAKSEALARLAADADCKSRAGLCAGACTTGTCMPYAHVWNTATVTGISNPTGFAPFDIFTSVINGCSTTAYYTCKCGC